MAAPLRAVPSPFDHAAPRPYSWKTDEFQSRPDQQRGTAPVGREAATSHLHQQSAYAPLAYQQQGVYAPWHCPRCMSTFLPRLERRISTGGWITFGVLLVFFFPLFWIGLLIKEDVKICPTCLSRVG
ncbi:MAG: LITAF-like zinc ribbon domain-containing protein [Acidobacteria bacterium]|nr:LITAF-like zinc ribbon domain-containing protein [Acidobacteriota bacterium]